MSALEEGAHLATQRHEPLKCPDIRAKMGDGYAEYCYTAKGRTKGVRRPAVQNIVQALARIIIGDQLHRAG